MNLVNTHPAIEGPFAAIEPPTRGEMHDTARLFRSSGKSTGGREIFGMYEKKRFIFTVLVCIEIYKTRFPCYVDFVITVLFSKRFVSESTKIVFLSMADHWPFVKETGTMI